MVGVGFVLQRLDGDRGRRRYEKDTQSVDLTASTQAVVSNKAMSAFASTFEVLIAPATA